MLIMCMTIFRTSVINLIILLQGVTGFLPAKDYATYYGADAPLLPGCLLDVAVTKAAAAAAAAAAAGGSSSSSVVQVSVAHDAVSGGQLQQWEGLNMTSLLPGALVSCRVRQVRIGYVTCLCHRDA
jgi:hypothetical protein